MSWTTGTQTEALAVNSAVSTAFTGSSAAAILMPSGAAYTPSNFWLASYGQSKTLTFLAWGVYSGTSTPSLTFGISANTTQGMYNSAAIAATTGAVVQGAPTAKPWEAQIQITFTGAIGASATYITSGLMKMYPTLSTLLVSPVTSSASTISTQSAYYWEYFGLWSGTGSITINGSTCLGLN